MPSRVSPVRFLKKRAIQWVSWMIAICEWALTMRSSMVVPDRGQPTIEDVGISIGHEVSPQFRYPEPEIVCRRARVVAGAIGREFYSGRVIASMIVACCGTAARRSARLAISKSAKSNPGATVQPTSAKASGRGSASRAPNQ